jgi:hypothetical protein
MIAENGRDMRAVVCAILRKNDMNPGFAYSSFPDLCSLKIGS